MRELAKVKEDDSLVRDLSSNALLSIDRSALERRKKQKQDREFQQNTTSKIEELLERVKLLEEWIEQHG